MSAIGRTLIPRYFRSIFDGGVSELYFHLKLAKESFHSPTITLDCDQCTMVTHHTVKPMFTKVYFNPSHCELLNPSIDTHFLTKKFYREIFSSSFYVSVDDLMSKFTYFFIKTIFHDDEKFFVHAVIFIYLFCQLLFAKILFL